jgi:nucleoside-diphosphate-sugar epimerase
MATLRLRKLFLTPSSNVGGTENVLEFARQCKIKEFHHVSTAYVCGLRTGKCLESELDVGQSFGNDYERSKLRAESLVHQATWLDQSTIYRPAIIVGDSRTGFSSTFHGFYTPLKIVSSAVQKLDMREVQSESFMDVLGLRGHEQKNLVPVDWVGEVLVDLMLNPRAHGATYHLTPRETVSIQKLLDVTQRSIEAQAVNWDRAKPAPANQEYEWGDLLATFVQQMESYRAYWRDDPVFDFSNTERMAGHLACPQLDDPTLLRLCKFAMDHNFWWSKGNRVDEQSAWRRWVDSLQPASSEVALGKAPAPERVNVQSLGKGGGDWVLSYDGSQWLRCHPGINPDVAVTIVGTNDTLGAVVSGTLPVEQAIERGSLVLLGTSESEGGRDLARSLTPRRAACPSEC